MASHNELGKWGEAKAISFLQDKGYRILEQDWRSGHRDLDIIAVTPNGMTLVFVEVKTRRNETFLPAASAVDYRKTRNLTMAANFYVKTHFIDLPIRFDIIAVIGTTDADCRIEHIEQAFIPPVFYRH